MPQPVAAVLEMLALSGVFRLGGVLVGTRAFLAFGPMLGVVFEGSAALTQDIDIAHEPTLGIALDRVIDVPRQLEKLDLGFHAVPKLDPRKPSTSFKVRGRDLRVDFLTPLIGREKEDPVFIPALKVAAHPLRLLDYLIDSPVNAVVIARRGILVRLPDPSRFALHKLWTATQRRPDQHLRARKDVAQAEVLLETLISDRPDDLVAAWQALAAHPEGLGHVQRRLERLRAEVRDGLRALVA